MLAGLALFTHTNFDSKPEMSETLYQTIESIHSAAEKIAREFGETVDWQTRLDGVTPSCRFRVVKLYKEH